MLAATRMTKKDFPDASGLPRGGSASPSAFWRVFCAIEIPADVRQRVLDRADHLRAASPGVSASWSRMDNIHLTLKFFGDVEFDKIFGISSTADGLAQRFHPFMVRVEGAGAFPSHGLPRVLWIGMNDSRGELIELQREFDKACANLGFTSEDRKFHPHLTLARLRSAQGSRDLADLHKETKFEAVEFVVGELTIFRSELSSKGSKYSVISQHALSANS